MKKNTWDEYFTSHLKPLGSTWGKRDLEWYRMWYYAWIKYIERKVMIMKKRSRYLQCFEIGSGIGSMASLIHDLGIVITGSDISKEIVHVANKVNKGIPFIYCDIQKGIKTKQTYDIIFGFEVLEHLPTPEKGITEIIKSLKNGGYFIGSSPYPFKKNYADPTHCSVKYPSEWKDMFKTLGFSNVTIYPMSFLPGIWRLNKHLNVVLPVYIPFSNFVSTSLIIAKK